MDEDAKGRSDEIAAKAVGVSRGYVADAKKIKDVAPETFEKLKSGEVTMAEAKKELPPPERERFHVTIDAAERIGDIPDFRDAPG